MISHAYPRVLDENRIYKPIYMDDLSKMSPWALFGYNAKYDLTWQGRTQDLIADVENRAREYKSSKPG
jgi:hypothetical protein